MDNLTSDEKLKIVDSILKCVDNVNVVIQTPNYIRKYGDIDYDLGVSDEPSLKRFLIVSRERLRKILLVDWLNDHFTSTQVTDITNTLSLTRQKISQLFTN